METGIQKLISSPKLLCLTAFCCALFALTVSFSMVNNNVQLSNNNAPTSQLFIIGPGNTQTSLANNFNGREKPIIETAVTAAKEGIQKNSKSLLKEVANDLADGFSDGLEGK
jgi:hypothetical protein